MNMLNLKVAISLIFRSWGQSLICSCSILLAFLLYGLTMSFDNSFSVEADFKTDSRLISAHKHSRQLSLPVNFLNIIGGIDGVKIVSPRQSFGGWYQNPNNSFPQYVVSPLRDLQVHQLTVQDASQQQRFLAGGNAVLVSEKLAERYQWHVGQQIQINSTLWLKPDGDDRWQFVIAGMIETQSLEQSGQPLEMMLIADDTFKAELPYAANLVGWYVTALQDNANAQAVAAEIDQKFSIYTTPTITTTEKAYASSMANQLGVLGQISVRVSIAVFLLTILSTLLFFMQNVAQNKALFAILQAVGFAKGRLFLLLLTAALIFCIPPAIFGLFIAHAAIPVMKEALHDILPALSFDPSNYFFGIIASGFLGLLSAVCIVATIRFNHSNQLREE